MELQFLGTGAGMPSKQRNTAAVLLNLAAEGEGYWLFDCGEATQHQLLHTSLKPRKINKIFITHLHGDHIFGLPGLLGSRSFLGGDEKLELYGPAGLREWINTTLRITKTHLNYELVIKEITEGTVFEDDSYIVRTKLLQHGIPSYGYRVEQKPLPGKLLMERVKEMGVPSGPLLKQLKTGENITLEDGTIVYSSDVTGEPQPGFIVTILGDTSFCKAAIELADHADIVVHEATYDSTTGLLAKEYGHSTISDAAETARQANAGTCIATHISARFLPSDVKRMKEEGRLIFPNLFIAEDFSQYEWKHGEIIAVDGEKSCKE